jgi:hypothetical protein
VSGFDWQSSFTWNCLVRLFGPKLRHEELVSIAELVGPKVGIRVDRNARRRKVVMIEWFKDNWPVIEPFLLLVVLDRTDPR